MLGKVLVCRKAYKHGVLKLRNSGQKSPKFVRTGTSVESLSRKE